MRGDKFKILLISIFLIVLCLCLATHANAYYGLYGGLYGMYGGLYGMYGGLYGMYGGMYGMYGMYGGMYGMYGMSPFSVWNLYYPVQTTGGLTYQIPFMQVAPLLGVAGLYNQLFPNLFNPTFTTTVSAGTTSII